MKLNKKDIDKLRIFSDYLSKYLSDFKNKNYFYYAVLYQKELCDNLIEAKTMKEANEIFSGYGFLDDKIQIKDMLRAKELHFRCSPESPDHYYKFTYIKN